jgi:hypothetical protein
MWSEFWGWFYGHYIFHAIVVVAIIFLIFFPGRLYKIFGKFKKVKAGIFELQTDEAIDPNTPCPYKASRDVTFGQLHDVNSKVDKLTIEVQEIMAIVKNMSIDQQKSSFYDEHQPDAERLAAGLKYIYQGGNGFTKPDVIVFANEHRDIYNALTRVKPELRLIS